MTGYSTNRFRVLRRSKTQHPSGMETPWDLVCSTPCADRAEKVAQEHKDRFGDTHEIRVVGRLLTANP